MDDELRELDGSLGVYLVRLLAAHGVEATWRQDGLVQVGADPSRWARLTATRASASSPIRLHVDAGGPGGSTLTDSLTGLGRERDLALKDALHHFCLGDFHVLLAGLWGLLEEDQVEYVSASTERGDWDLYFGGWISRMTDPQRPLPAPPGLVAALIDAVPRLFEERRARVGRVFVSAINGELTYEGLVDMQPSEELEAILRSFPLAPPASGYASQRLFFLAVPRDDRPAHARVGRCAAPP